MRVPVWSERYPTCNDRCLSTHLGSLNLPRIFLRNMTLRLTRELVYLGIKIHLPHRQALCRR